MKDRYQIEQETAHVKSAITDRFIDKEPDTPQTAICPKHGEYTFKNSPSFGSKVLCISACCKCVEDRDKFIDSEVIRIEQEHKIKCAEDRILNSGVSKRNLHKTFDTFLAETKEQVKAKALYEEFAASVCNGETVKSLIVCGSVGTGKTHLASATVNAITKCEVKRSEYYSNKIYKKCVLVKIIDLIRQFKSTWSKDNDNTEEKFLNYYTNIDALIIDEVGVQFGSDTEKMIIFDIIDGRYNNMLPTALISNLALPDVQELIGERAIDRMREDGGVVVAMSWESHRGLK